MTTGKWLRRPGPKHECWTPVEEGVAEGSIWQCIGVDSRTSKTCYRRWIVHGKRWHLLLPWHPAWWTTLGR